MLDNCSQTTLMWNKRLGALGLHKCRASITVKTMNGEIAKPSEVLNDIEAAQASNEREEKKYWLNYLADAVRRI